MPDFPYIGEPVGLVLSRLGLPLDTIIKIRRKIPTGVLRQLSLSQGGLQSMSAASTSGRVEMNQSTFRAEAMYSYRNRAESLWGTREEVDASQLSQPTGGIDQEVPRKRWVSDADASNLVGAANSEETKNGEPSRAKVTDTYTDIYPVTAAEPIQAGDVLFLSCAQTTMIDFQAITVSQKLKGLKFLDVSALDLPGHGTEFFEVVLSDHNQFVGRSPGLHNSEFASYYGCSVVAVRRRGDPEATSVAAPAIGRSNSFGLVGASASVSRSGDAAEARLEEGMGAGAALEIKHIPIVPATPLTPSNTSQSGRRAVSASNSRTSIPISTANPAPHGGESPRSNVSVVAAKRPRSPVRSWRKDRVKSAGTEEARAIEVTQQAFKAGDVILVLAKEEFMEKFSSTKDFFLLSKVGSVPKPVRAFDYLPLVAFLAMLIVVLLDIDMVRAACRRSCPRAHLIVPAWDDARGA